jgi:hypothetical protein
VILCFDKADFQKGLASLVQKESVSSVGTRVELVDLKEYKNLAIPEFTSGLIDL